MVMDRDDFLSRGRGILSDTLSFIDSLASLYGELPGALEMLRSAETTVELKNAMP